MPARKTQEQFISESIRRHKGKYDYSKVIYVNSQTKIIIICPEHGQFSMKPNSHSNGQGCPKCGRIRARKNIRKNWESVYEKIKKVHGDKYTYVEESYTAVSSEMLIICPIHGEFTMKPHSHISMKAGCPKCGKKQAAENNRKSWEVVYKEILDVHGDRYEYDVTSYSFVDKKIRIKCSKHGWFKQRVSTHKNGSGCRKCQDELTGDRTRVTKTDFISRANMAHGLKYDYSHVVFIDQYTPVKIICNLHGEFEQTPRIHYRGSGCQKCIESRGETSIRVYLDNHDINFETQKTFIGMEDDRPLKCDFYLPDFNLVIEFNGKQHYEPVELFGGYQGFMETVKRDKIKKKYCQDNGINFQVIHYEENITDRLEKLLKN
ncbi:MAG: hypothetical protein P8P00_06110 [Polaribacter sp.]|nr:hypothetical protein [Polaribacter sp.]